MTEVQATMEVRAPIDYVFATLIDPLRTPEWNPNVTNVRGVSGPVREGSHWQQSVAVLGRPQDVQCVVTKMAPPTYGEMTVSGPQRARLWTRCEDLGDRTRVTQGIDFQPPGGILGMLAGGMATGMVQRELDQTMERERVLLEAEGGYRR